MKPLDAESRRLIAEASLEDVPSSETEERVWRALSTRLEQPLPPSAEAVRTALESVPKSALGAAPWLKLGIAGLIGAGIVGTLLLRAPRSESGREGHAGAHAELPDATRTPGPVTTPIGLGASDGSQPAASSPGGAVGAPAPEPDATPASPGSTLRAETELIARAQRALQHDAGAEALAALAQHAARHRDGLLVQEREALRLIALCSLRRPVEASALRRQFVRSWPDSPLLPRVADACRESPDEPARERLR
jgi:hypothetical protein